MSSKKDFKKTGADLFFSEDKSSLPDVQENTAESANDIKMSNTLNNALTNTSSTNNSNIQSNTLVNIKHDFHSYRFSDVLENIPKSEPIGANLSFYLSADTAAAIAQVAKQKRISRSKLVDSILKQILLEGGQQE